LLLFTSRCQLEKAVLVIECYEQSLLKKHSIDSSIFQEVQNEREQKLVQLLLKRIEPYVSEDKLAFVAWARKERESLKDNGKYNSFFSLGWNSWICFCIILKSECKVGTPFSVT